MEELMREPRTALALGFFAVTLGPICEELLFRGLLQPLAVRTFGVVAGILTAALPFALLHGPQYAWSWQHVLLILMAGAAFGYARYRTGSTAMATVMHAGYNFTFFAIVFFQRGLV
jgi:membrane protease YdiL (CAAX protease family)